MSIWHTSELCRRIEQERAQRDAEILAEKNKERRENIKAWERHNVRVPKVINDDALRPPPQPLVRLARQKAAAARWRNRGVRGEMSQKIMAAFRKEGPMTLAQLARRVTTSAKGNLSHACITLARRGELHRGQARMTIVQRRPNGKMGTVKMRVPLYCLPEQKHEIPKESLRASIRQANSLP